ncbi:MAG: PfkB family carbohydrate kinase [Candidatus Bilamarchaeaceae archaeon]
MENIFCAGSVALDTTITPFARADRVLGGAAVYFSMAARLFSPVEINAVVGNDFPKEYVSLLREKGINLDGLQTGKGKTFFYESEFSYDMYHRKTLRTELNVLADFRPRLSENGKKARFFYLATMPPESQLELLRAVPKGSMRIVDTIELYIKENRSMLMEVLANCYGVVLNDEESRMLANESSLVKSGKKILSMGPKFAVVKKGEHGALLFYANDVIPFSALPMEEVTDPTGAGDAFAGGLMGILAQKSTVNPTLYDLKQAVAYGNVMGSFAVEDFSIKRLADISVREVEERYRYYSGLMRL